MKKRNHYVIYINIPIFSLRRIQMKVMEKFPGKKYFIIPVNKESKFISPPLKQDSIAVRTTHVQISRVVNILYFVSP
jgi:hypothetical protein